MAIRLPVAEARAHARAQLRVCRSMASSPWPILRRARSLASCRTCSTAVLLVWYVCSSGRPLAKDLRVPSSLVAVVHMRTSVKGHQMVTACMGHDQQDMHVASRFTISGLIEEGALYASYGCLRKGRSQASSASKAAKVEERERLHRKRAQCLRPTLDVSDVLLMEAPLPADADKCGTDEALLRERFQLGQRAGVSSASSSCGAAQDSMRSCRTVQHGQPVALQATCLLCGKAADAMLALEPPRRQRGKTPRTLLTYARRLLVLLLQAEGWE
eukprot:6186461-Pleurochrysis_carterae.AAC.2